MNLTDLDLVAAAEGVAAGRFSARELVEAALTPIYPTVSGMGQSTWRKLCRQALSIVENNPPVDLLHDIIEDRINLVAAIAFLHNPPPNADLIQIQDGNHPAQLRLAQEELIAHIRRHSSAFSRGKSRYRGVSGHHGRWEARIGTYYNRKNVSFGVYDTEEDAARQYDRALIIQRGRGAKTNFDVSAYDQEVAQYSREKRGRGASYEEALRQTIIACQSAEDAKRKARSEEAEPEPAKPAVRQCTRRALPT